MPEIGPEELPVVELFLHLGTQWRRHPLTGMPDSIIYEAIRPTADMLEMRVTPDVLHALRVMEVEAHNAWVTSR